MKKMTLASSLFVSLVASAAQAAPLNCTVKNVAGTFMAFTQPQVGDKAKLDLTQEISGSIKIGHSVISVPGTLKRLSLEGIDVFSGVDSGNIYSFQINAYGVEGGPIKVTSVITDPDGIINAGVIQLECSPAKAAGSNL